jgi:hypothetical protein
MYSKLRILVSVVTLLFVDTVVKQWLNYGTHCCTSMGSTVTRKQYGYQT